LLPFLYQLTVRPELEKSATQPIKMDNPKIAKLATQPIKMDNLVTQPVKVNRLKIHKPEALLDKTLNRQR
jgi:hypothetical protein